MRQVIYRPDRYVAETESSRLVVACDPKTSTYAVYPEDEETTMGRLPLDGDQALRLAAYILATHSEAAGGENFEGLAFAPSTTSCEELPHPDFVVVPPVDGDAHSDPLQYRAEVNRRLGAAFSKMAEAINNGPASTESEPPAADEPEDLGLLHPDQDRRLTALREAREILGRYAPGGQVLELAEWILTGTAATSAAEGGEQA